MAIEPEKLIGVSNACCCCLQCPERLSDMTAGDPSPSDVMTSCFRYRVVPNAKPFMMCDLCKRHLFQSWNFFRKVKATQALLQKITSESSEIEEADILKMNTEAGDTKNFLTSIDGFQSGRQSCQGTVHQESEKNLFIKHEITEEAIAFGTGFQEGIKHRQTCGNYSFVDIPKPMEIEIDPEEFYRSRSDSDSQPLADFEDRNITTLNKFNCHICTESFTVQRELISHLKSHVRKRRNAKAAPERPQNAVQYEDELLQTLGEDKCDLAALKCLICQRTFKNHYKLKYHLTTHVYSINSINCGIENECDPSPYVIGPKDLTCRICHESFQFNRLLILHMPQHFPNYKCDGCGKIFAKKEHMKSHLKRMHPDGAVECPPSDVSRQTTCGICNKTYKFRHKLKEHLKTHFYSSSVSRANTVGPETSLEAEADRTEEYLMDPNDLTCKICNETFQWHKTLVKHMSVHFPNYVCATCGKCFAKEKSLKNHVLAHDNLRFACGFCDRSYNRKASLKMHLKKHSVADGGGGERDFECPHCPERFSTRYKKVKHLCDVHNDLAKHGCMFCSKSFYLAGDLKIHIVRCHSLERKYSCTQCGCTFSIKSDLEKHMIKHSPEKKFRCLVCDKWYARKATLVEHMRIHNDDKRYQCEICEKRFLQKNALILHLRTHEKRR